MNLLTCTILLYFFYCKYTVKKEETENLNLRIEVEKIRFHVIIPFRPANATMNLLIPKMVLLPNPLQYNFKI